MLHRRVTELTEFRRVKTGKLFLTLCKLRQLRSSAVNDFRISNASPAAKVA